MDNKQAILYQNDPKYKLSDLNVPNSFFGSNKTLQRIDFTIPNARLFSIPSFLSEGECSKLIELTEAIGYKGVDWEYSKEYRDCKRLLTQSEKFAKEIWNRLLPKLVKEDVMDVKPFGFGTKGTWRPISINECLRFTKYEKGNHFRPHRDGGFVRTDENRSIYTFMIYLNEISDGGKTKFFSSEDNVHFKEEVNITPKTGTALVFNHDVWHEGEQVNSGIKYILRTDIMFQRIEADVNEYRDEYLKDPKYIKAMKLYDKSIEYQVKGNPAESTKYYLKALDMQSKLRSIPGEISMNFLGLSHDVSNIILDYLKDSELMKCSLVCKSWKRRVRDSSFWRQRFERDFENFAKIEIDSISELNPDISKNWYTIYKNRYTVEKKFNVVVVDVGASRTKYSIIGKPVLSFRSIAALYKGHYWGSRSGLSQFLVGDEITEIEDRIYNEIVPFNKDGMIDETAYNEIIQAIFERGFSKNGMQYLRYYELEPAAHPIILATNGESSLNISSKQKKVWKNLTDFCYRTFPYVCIMDSAILGVLAKGFHSGLMISVGHLHVRVTVVWQMQVIEDYPIAKEKVSAKWLAEKAAKSLQYKDFEQKRILANRVVIAGIPSMELLEEFQKIISEKVSGVKVHSWATIEQNLSYVIEGAKNLLSLSEPRKFFTSRKSNSEKKSSCKTQ